MIKSLGRLKVLGMLHGEASVGRACANVNKAGAEATMGDGMRSGERSTR